ncbi:uncharacterized protein [Amphiura filiformis]|uniref:uncharacterized protein n=1 Tax=Amphiura filiformis TaxID=82378 RepID=UPI003B20F811
MPPGSICQSASVTCNPYLAQHLGCYNDNIERALPNYVNCTQEPRCKCDFTRTGCLSDTAMTVELCKDICCNGATTFAFAGVEAGNGCYCGVATTNYKRWTPGEVALPNTDCYVQCVGNPTESCGADYKINVYGCNVGCEIPGSLSTNLVATPQLVVKLYDIGDTINFRCLGVTNLLGDAQITCQTDGGWSGAVRRCQDIVESFPTQPQTPTYIDITATLTSPGNGIEGCLPIISIHSDEGFISPVRKIYAYGDVITVYCKRELDLIGDEQLICLNTGSWLGEIPRCSTQDSSTPITTAVGVGVGIVVIVALVASVIYCKRKNKTKQGHSADSTPTPPTGQYAGNTVVVTETHDAGTEIPLDNMGYESLGADRDTHNYQGIYADISN